MMAFVSVSSASATEFKTESAPAEVRGTALVTIQTDFVQQCYLNTSSSLETMSTITLSGTVTGECPQFTKLGQGSVEPNGCKFVFGASGKFAIYCTEGHTFNIRYLSGCIFSFPSQTIISALTYNNLGSKSLREVEATLSATGLSYESSAACPSPGSHTDGSFTATYLLKSYNWVGTRQGLWYL